MDTVRVLIVDDLLSRKGIAAILRADPAFEVVGEAVDGEEALQKAMALRPDLVLMDVRMPGGGGIATTRRLKEWLPALKVVMLSVSNDPQDLLEAMRAGAQGYLLKDMEPERWLDYLRAVAAGDTPISRALAAALLNEFADSARRAAARAPDRLTRREYEVLQALARGMSNRAIATDLGVAESTVKNHVRNILGKLRLGNRTELVAYAYARRWVVPRDDPR